MPAAVALLLIDVLFVVHAAKTGRLTPWVYVILALPGIGAVAYVAVELVPEWVGSVPGQRARRRLAFAFDPEKDYRRLSDALAVADTVANRTALAEECMALGKFAEALTQFRAVLASPHGEEPRIFAGKARAEFGLGRPQDAVATLDGLRTAFPDWQSAEAHLLYARALDEAGRAEEALDEFAALAGYYPGAEARVRHGLVLLRIGRRTEAEAVLGRLLAEMARAPRFVRTKEAAWITAAEKALRA